MDREIHLTIIVLKTRLHLILLRAFSLDCLRVKKSGEVFVGWHVPIYLSFQAHGDLCSIGLDKQYRVGQTGLPPNW